MNKLDKKMVFITPVIPGEFGARTRVVFNYLKSLSEDFGYEISLIIINNNAEDYVSPPFINKLYLFCQPNKFIQIILIIFYSLIFRKAPMQTYLFWSPFLDIKIKKIILNINPNIVVCELIRTALYGVNLNINNMLDMADMFSRRYEQQLNYISEFSNITGQYEKYYPQFIRQIINSKHIKYFLLRNEYSLTKNFEKNITNYYNIVTLVSKVEVRILRNISKKKNIYWLANGVNFAHESGHAQYQTLGHDNIISFIGVLDMPHNELAVLYFIDEIFPLVLEKKPDAIFQVIGRNPSKRIIERGNKNINIIGYVEDIDNYIKKSTITVVPLKIGTGVKTKIFESLKFGIPVVATSIGGEGLIKELYDYIDIHDHPSKFADACVRLLNDNNSIDFPVDYIYKLIKKNYSWDSIGSHFDKLISSL